MEREIFMTAKEAYEKLGGNYEDVLCRVSEDMIPRLIGMLLRDTSYEDIRTGLKQQDYKLAFRGAHTLKGVALNLGLTPLSDKASILTETLRERQDNQMIQPAFIELEQAYRAMHMTFTEVLCSLVS